MLLLMLALQGVVVPPIAAGAEGNDLVMRPFAFDRARVVQYVGSSLLPDRFLIRDIAFRRDGEFGRRTTLRRVHWWNPSHHGLSIYIGSTAKPWPRVAPDRSRLIGVFSRRDLRYPDLPWVDAATQPFLLRFRLDRPYVHGGGDLLLDMETSNPLSERYEYYVDAVRHVRGRGRLDEIAASCAGTRASVAFADPLELNLVRALPNTPVACIVGAARLTTPCLHVRPDVAGVTLANDSGIARIRLPWQACSRFYVQWWPSSNALRVDTGPPPLDAMRLVDPGTRHAWIEDGTCVVMQWR